MKIPLYIPEHFQAQYEAHLAAIATQGVDGCDDFECDVAEPPNVSFSYAGESALGTSILYDEWDTEITRAPDESPLANKSGKRRSSLKRKRSQDDESHDSDVPAVPGVQALPVADSLPEDGIPTNGEEYLLSVRIDASSLPGITRAANLFEQVPRSYSQRTSPPIGRHPNLPSEKWIIMFCAKFNAFRQTVKRSNFRISLEAEAAAQSIRLPGPKDAPAWRSLIFQPKARKATSATSQDSAEVQISGALGENAGPPHEGTDVSHYSFEVDSDDEHASENHSDIGMRNIADGVSVHMAQFDGEDETTNEPPHESSFTQSPNILEDVNKDTLSKGPCIPNIAFLKLLESSDYSCLIAHFCHWLSQSLDEETELAGASNFVTALSPSHSKWLFSLLAHADDELMSGKEISTLRILARVCVELVRRSLNAEAKLRNSDASQDGGLSTEGEEREAWRETVLQTAGGHEIHLVTEKQDEQVVGWYWPPSVVFGANLTCGLRPVLAFMGTSTTANQ
ncbi:uncharacterized protein EI90DRAFT_3116569 [Cantharellus anzutake]|uniref:uncharacterized protein n=1 Tax=Cantharellus anzutake TaxID=1750568 RepID=UPI001908FDB4|nr:uncharacterized protein EI90DRAFT_3116569 [Cantharellus anzutake]KAF8341440.1 hypothetical protein EI90DRAFT_3116569 [Cantharellus anzutake]